MRLVAVNESLMSERPSCFGHRHLRFRLRDGTPESRNGPETTPPKLQFAAIQLAGDWQDLQA